MDFGFINSILRANFFPPLDMWYAPLPINYYYFGHLSGATLIKLINLPSAVGYNLILATIFALGITQVFSLITNLIVHLNHQKVFSLSTVKYLFLWGFGILGAFLVNLGGNLHTIYLFTQGYNNENPQPFWQIFSHWNPTAYWYPNATRFIPFTIHEFPSYSYVVADLHGHVFDIPFVLLTLALIFQLLLKNSSKNNKIAKKEFIFPMLLGFTTAVHYMTNAFDGPIYLLFSLIAFLIIYGWGKKFLIALLILMSTFWLFSLPFAVNFSPFVSGIGVNCGASYLEAIFKITHLSRFGPLLFEKNNCQVSPLWMLFILWGFFLLCFLGFALFHLFFNKQKQTKSVIIVNYYLLLLFAFGTFLILIPEFFYIKDIYPQHFRANTMFKLGYQAFIMFMIASSLFIYQLKNCSYFAFKLIWAVLLSISLIFIIIYPFFSIPSYYGALNRKVVLEGDQWLKTYFPQEKKLLISQSTLRGNQLFLRLKVIPILIMQHFAYTGLPTVAGCGCMNGYGEIS
jgi:YYY domain-containing protein